MFVNIYNRSDLETVQLSHRQFSNCLENALLGNFLIAHLNPLTFVDIFIILLNIECYGKATCSITFFSCPA